MMERPAVIDVDGLHSDEALSAAVVALSGALDACGGRISGVAIAGSHGFATYAAIAAGLRRGRRIVFLDSMAELAAVGPILQALDVTAIFDCAGAGATSSARVPDGIAHVDARAWIAGAAAGTATGAGLAGTNPGAIACRDYAIFTSGTTGEAKVIVQTIENLRAHIANYVGYTGIVEGSRVLQLASAGWDAGLMDLFACLFHGGVLCSIDPRGRELAAVRQFIADHAVDVLHMTVPYFRLLHADAARPYPAPRKVVVGGELIVGRDLERFDAVAPAGSTLYNAYGPTECTTALYNVHRRGEPMTSATWPLAFGVAGVEVALALAGSRVDGAGTTGELVLRSALVARRLDASTGATVALDRDVFGTGALYYATGDLAHRDDAGRIVITGRTDSVIKVNGQKVSLHEIETVVRSLDGVADTCLVVEAGEADAFVIAAIVARDASVELPALRRALAARLPAHKLPKQLLRVDRLPLTRNNKLDRPRILALAAADRAAAGGAVAEESPLLRELRRVMRGAPIDPALSFIENGGDSLRALSLVAALKRAGIRISLDQLLSAAPIRQLVAGDAPAPVAAAVAAPPAVAALADLALPNRAFLEGRGIPDLDRWSQAVVFDYRGPRAAAELAQIVEAVLARHTAGWPGAPVRVPVLDGVLVSAAVAAASQRISRQEGRIVDAAVVVDPAGVHVVAAVHQFSIDRASWLVLLAEIADAARDGAAAVRTWPAPELDQRGWIARYQQHRAGELAGDVWSRLPWERCADVVTAAPLPARASFRRVTIELAGRAAQGALADVDQALLAAALIGLAALTGRAHQKIDILGHGRDLVAGGFDAAGIVGWFTVIYPLVLEVPPDPSAAVRAVSALRAQLAPIAHTFGNEHYRPAARPRWRCDVSYNFIGDLELASTGELAVNPISIETMHGAASHPLELSGYRAGAQILLVIDHDPRAIDAAAIERLTGSVRRAFAAMEGR